MRVLLCKHGRTPVDKPNGFLFFVEDNEHGKAGSTRMLVFTLPKGLNR